MCKPTRKAVMMSVIVICVAVVASVLLIPGYRATIYQPLIESKNQSVELQKQPLNTTSLLPTPQQPSLSAVTPSVPAVSTPSKAVSSPEDLVGNLPMAPISLNAFNQTTLFGYSNPLALITAAHQKTLKILSEGGNLKPVVLQMALRAYACAHAQNIGNPHYLTIIDYSLPSITPRMWVIDMKTATVSFHTLVAHGKNSGYIYTDSFSNAPGSDASSIGLFLTQNTYIGHEGYSLRLKGLEKGFNDNAMERSVVIHGANYVSPLFVKDYGRLGRSWGCLAVARTVATPVINEIKNGTLVFAYYPQPAWEKSSTYLHCSVPLPWHW